MLPRRQFLAAPAALLQNGRKIRAAFLGASHAHGPAKVAVVKASPDFDLVGIWEEDSRTRASLEKLGDLRWLSKEQILADHSIEAVFIDGPVHTHAPLAIEALEAGKHCHIEKPASDNLRDMRRVVDLAKSKGLLIQSGYMWRYNPAVERALEAARNRWLGDIYSIHARMNMLTGLGERPGLARFPGGILFELGSHLIDIIVRLLGRPQRITPFLRHDSNIADSLNDNTLVVLEYPRTLAMVVSSALQPSASPHRTIEIFGTQGSAVIHPPEPPSLEIDLITPAGPYSKGRQKVQLPPYSRYVDDVAALAQAIRGEKPLSTTPDTEMAVTEVLLTASRMVG